MNINHSSKENTPGLNEFIEKILPKHRIYFLKENPNAIEIEFLESLCEIYSIDLSDYLRIHGEDIFDDEVYKNKRIIEYLKSKIAEQKVNDNRVDEDSRFLGKYSDSQTVLIYDFIFDYFGMYSKDKDKTEIARLIHLVSGKKFDKPSDSNIYQKLRLLPDIHITPSKLEKDLLFIKPLFEQYKFTEIVEKIDARIILCKKKKETDKNL